MPAPAPPPQQPSCLQSAATCPPQVCHSLVECQGIPGLASFEECLRRHEDSEDLGWRGTYDASSIGEVPDK